MLELGAAFYDSLQSAEHVKNMVKGRFLQLLVLLLSLLNEEDRASIQLYVEATYGIQADRANLELLIMKVRNSSFCQVCGAGVRPRLAT